MLRSVLGSYIIQSDIWDTESAMVKSLEHCTLGTLHINNNKYPKDKFYTLRMFSEEGVFGITLTTYDNGLSPCVLYQQATLMLILAHGKNVYFIDVYARKTVATINLDYEFYQFHVLDHLGQHSFFLIQTEFDVIACTYSGNPLWTYLGEDVITGFYLSKTELRLQIMKGDYHTIRLVDGVEL